MEIRARQNPTSVSYITCSNGNTARNERNELFFTAFRRFAGPRRKQKRASQSKCYRVFIFVRQPAVGNKRTSAELGTPHNKRLAGVGGLASAAGSPASASLMTSPASLATTPSVKFAGRTNAGASLLFFFSNKYLNRCLYFLHSFTYQ